jgi:hypothetical protein
MSTAVLAAALLVAPAQMPADPPPIVTTVKETGAKPSAYRGKYFDPRHEGFRKCVAQREGRHQYWVTGSNGTYVGTYQMTRALARGAVWMMSKEWRARYGAKTARDMRTALHSTDPRKWSREIWDQAFWTVLNWEGPLSGVNHWRGGRFSCTPGMTWAGGNR